MKLGTKLGIDVVKKAGLNARENANDTASHARIRS
jgi:hypothetical protein